MITAFIMILWFVGGFIAGVLVTCLAIAGLGDLMGSG